MYLVCFIWKQKDLNTLWRTKQLVEGLNLASKRNILIYQIWFTALWICLTTIVSLKEILNPVILVSFFLALICLSVLQSVIFKIYENWIKQAACIMMELSLFVLAFITSFSEYFISVSPKTQDKISLPLIIYFCANQILVMIIL